MHLIKSKDIHSLGSKKMLRELEVQCTGVYRLYIKNSRLELHFPECSGEGDMSGTKRGAQRSRQ